MPAPTPDNSDPPNSDAPEASTSRSERSKLQSAVTVLEGDGSTECAVYFDVVEELLFAAGWRDEPCCAALGGHIGASAGGSEAGDVVVTRFSGLSYTADARGMMESCRGAIERMAHADDDAEPVGLFVGSPGSEGRLDEQLGWLHLSLLNGPGRVLVVADPNARTLGVYSRPDGQPFEAVDLTVLYEPEVLEEQQEGASPPNRASAAGDEVGEAGKDAAESDETSSKESVGGNDSKGDDDGDADDGSDERREHSGDRSAGDSGQPGQPDD